MVSELATETWLGWTGRLIFLKKLFARETVFITPGRCAAVMVMSKCVMRTIENVGDAIQLCLLRSLC